MAIVVCEAHLIRITEKWKTVVFIAKSCSPHNFFVQIWLVESVIGKQKAAKICVLTFKDEVKLIKKTKAAKI